ncbi:MAG: hypothetical protein WA821_02280 [Anaerolineales bacterium]
MNKKLIVGLVWIVMALAVSAAALPNISKNASKSYHSLTRVTYSNRILNQTSCCWNGGFTDSTTPGRSMDTFAVTVWTTYITCKGQIDYRTWYSTSEYQYNRISISDGVARTKSVACTGKKPREVHNDIKHYWQDGGYTGDGGTIAISEIQ